MTDRYDSLRALFERVSSTDTFVERQAAPRGALPSDLEVDRRLAGVVADLRERTGFRTSLSDAALVTVVRRTLAGDGDATIAAALGVDARTVARARVNLHLFRPADLDSPVLEAVRERLDAGASVAEAARDLGVSEATVRRHRHVIETRRAARNLGDRYRAEFEAVLSDAALERAVDASQDADRAVLLEASE
jgi:DNA-binding NarL/FixJ family response regulator